MNSPTLGELISHHGISVEPHFDRSLEVPVLDGLQVQGDLAVIPVPSGHGQTGAVTVPAEGIPVIEASDGGHEHRLLAGEPGSASWAPAAPGGQDLGILECAAPAYLAHPEHAFAAIAPGTYLLRRQREEARTDDARLVAD